MTNQTASGTANRAAATTARPAPRRQRAAVPVLATGAALAVWAVAAALTDGPQIVAAGTTQQVGPVEGLQRHLVAFLDAWLQRPLGGRLPEDPLGGEVAPAELEVP